MNCRDYEIRAATLFPVNQCPIMKEFLRICACRFEVDVRMKTAEPDP